MRRLLATAVISFFIPLTLFARAQAGDEATTAASQSVSTPSRSDYDEELTVIGEQPEITALEMFETYDSRRKGHSLYDEGKYAEAFPYLLAAAKRGFKMAQAQVGYIYQQGLGDIPRDAQAAIGWIGVAATGRTRPQISKYWRSLVARIPPENMPYVTQIVDDYTARYGAEVNGLDCHFARRFGTSLKALTCQFVDEGARFRDGTDTRELEDFYMPQDPGDQP